MTMALIWLETWEMGMIEAAGEAAMKAIQIAQRQQRVLGRSAQQPADDCQHRILHIAKIVVRWGRAYWNNFPAL